MIARYQGVVLVHLAKAAVRSTKSDSPFRQYDGPTDTGTDTDTVSKSIL
jgi:hypothetical protein